MESFFKEYAKLLAIAIAIYLLIIVILAINIGDGETGLISALIKILFDSLRR